LSAVKQGTNLACIFPNADERTMNFNIPTAMQMTATLTLLVALVLAYAARQFPRAVQQPMLIWIRGLLIQSVPYFLYACRAYVPTWMSVILADALMVVALAVQMHALRRFTLQSNQDIHMRLVIAATIIGEVLLTYTWHSPRACIILMSLAVAAIACFGVDAIYRRRTITRAEHMVGMLLFAGITIMLLRAVIVPSTSMVDLSMSSPMQGIVFTYAASMPVISTVVFVLMCGERVNSDATQQAMIDPLTGVYNRQTMAKLANSTIAKAGRQSEPLALLSIDIDHFRRFNEDFGYDAGDAAVCHVIDILREVMRSSDVIARVAGEQFAVLLLDTNEADALELAERMRQRVDESGFTCAGWPAPLQISIGVSVRDAESSFDELLRTANQALGAAKGAGRNRVATPTSIEAPAGA
jgi:diguanylate cyclase (GGDEF)-like protein